MNNKCLWCETDIPIGKKTCNSKRCINYRRYNKVIIPKKIIEDYFNNNISIINKNTLLYFKEHNMISKPSLELIQIIFNNKISKINNLDEYIKLYVSFLDITNKKYNIVFDKNLEANRPWFKHNPSFKKRLKANNLDLFNKVFFKKCLNCNELFEFGNKFTLFCSRKCYYKAFFNESSPYKRIYSEESKKKQSITMKKLIKEGKFTPCVTNSWCYSRCYIDNIPFRSSWEALFYLLNNSLSYEKIRIEYYINDIKRIYITDFQDYNNKIIYEIKPNSEESTEINKAKKQYALKWCDENNWKYIIVGDNYFMENIENFKNKLYLVKDKDTLKKLNNSIKNFIKMKDKK